MGGIFGGSKPKGPSAAEKAAVAKREKAAKAREAAEKRSIAARRNAASKGNTMLMMTDRDNAQMGIDAPTRALEAGRNPRDMAEALRLLNEKRKKNLGPE